MTNTETMLWGAVLAGVVWILNQIVGRLLWQVLGSSRQDRRIYVSRDEYEQLVKHLDEDRERTEETIKDLSTRHGALQTQVYQLTVEVRELLAELRTSAGGKKT